MTLPNPQESLQHDGAPAESPRENLRRGITEGMPSDSTSLVAVADSPPDFNSLPMWQRRYLGAIAAGLTEHECIEVANVTAATISDWLIPGHRAYSSTFARAEELVRIGKVQIPTGELQARAKAYSSVALDDAFSESRDKEIAPRDRLGNRRYMAEVSGVLDANRGAQSQAQQINVVFQFSGAPDSAVVVDVSPSTPKPKADA